MQSYWKPLSLLLLVLSACASTGNNRITDPKYPVYTPSGVVIERGEDYQPPRLVSGNSPSVPFGFQFSGAKVVVLSFAIGADGSVSDIRVATTTGIRELDGAAVAAASQWRYQPAVFKGAPYAVFYNVTVTFEGS
jgi:TonB family protein